MHTFSFSSVSAFSEAARDSLEPSGRTGGGGTAPFIDPLLAPGAERDEEIRGDAAARAVAPLGIPVVVVFPVPETVFGERRVWPAGGRVAVVADMRELYRVYVVTLEVCNQENALKQSKRYRERKEDEAEHEDR